VARNLVPRVGGEGSLGREDKRWEAVFAVGGSFTGDVEVPTQAASDDSTKIATTAHVKSVVADYAPLASPALTGTPTAPTATAGTSTEQIATTKFVITEVNAGIASNDAMALRGTLGTGGTTASLPTEDYLVGWTYKVVSSGTYAGQACSIGDLMICVSSFNTAYKDADWSRVPISDEYSDYYLLEGDPA